MAEAEAMRKVFTLPVIQLGLRVKAAACRKLARQHDVDSLDAINWNGLADELESDADALQWWIGEKDEDR